VCRLGPTLRAVEARVQDGEVLVIPNRRAHGSYTLTYYACDDSYLTAGTLTVKVKPPAPTLEIVPLGDGPPGPVRLVNTYKNRAFHCQWQRLGSNRIEGKTVVRPLSTVVIRVREAEFSLDCESPGVSISAVFTVTGLSTVARPQP
jgi:hypothetical protein